MAISQRKRGKAWRRFERAQRRTVSRVITPEDPKPIIEVTAKEPSTPTTLPKHIYVVTFLWGDYGSKTFGTVSSNFRDKKTSKEGVSGPEYVNRLYRGVKNNYSGDFTFKVFVDRSNAKIAVDEGIEVCEMHPPSYLGCLPKLWAFNIAENGIEEGSRVVVHDVDTVICGSLDRMYSATDKFICRADEKTHRPGGGMLGFKAGIGQDIYDLWKSKGKGFEVTTANTNKRFHAGGSERAVYYHYIKPDTYWQDICPNMLLNYKRQYVKFGYNKEMLELASVVVFGGIRCHDMPKDCIVRTMWELGVAYEEPKNSTNGIHIYTVAFGKAFKPLIDAHVKSIHKNATYKTYSLVDPGEPASGNTAMPKYAKPNHHKLKIWRDLVTDNIGRDIVLIDADTLVLKDLRPAFNHDFDIAFTIKKGNRIPMDINAGVVFVRCSERTADFFNMWCDKDDEIFNDRKKFNAAQKLARGQNQASLGLLLTGNKKLGCDIEYLSCHKWNCVPPYLVDMTDNTAIIHVKNGPAGHRFRDHVLSSGRKSRKLASGHEKALNQWKKYAS